MNLNREQIESILQNAPEGADRKQILDGLISKGYNLEGVDNEAIRQNLQRQSQEVAIEKQRDESLQMGAFEEAGQDIRQIGEGIGEAKERRLGKFEEIEQAQASGEQGAIRSIGQKVGQGFGFAGDVIGELAIGAGKLLLPEEAEQAVGEGFENVATKIAETGVAQKAIQGMQTLQQENPALARDLEGIMNFGLLGLDIVGAGAGSKAGKQVARQTIKKTGQAVEGTAKGATKLTTKAASEIEGTLTGTSGETIEEAFKASVRGDEALESFTSALRKKTTPEQIVENVRSVVADVNKRKSDGFSNMINKVGGDTVDTSKIIPAVEKSLDEIGVKIGKDGLDFSNSKFRTSTQAKTKIQEMYDEVLRFGPEATIDEVDTTRQALGILMLSGDDASAKTANRAITQAIDSVRKAGQTNKTYKKALAEFGEDAQFLGEIEKSLATGNKKSIDTAYRKLVTSLKTNNEQRLKLLEELDEIADGRLIPMIAGQQLSEEMPRGLFKQIAAGMAGAGIVTGGISMSALLPTMVIASPRLAGEFLRVLGLSKKMSDTLIKQLKPVGKAITKAGETAGQVGGAAIAPAVIEEAKN